MGCNTVLWCAIKHWLGATDSYIKGGLQPGNKYYVDYIVLRLQEDFY